MPGFKVALDKLVGKQKMPRHAVLLGAGGGARAVVHGLITEGFQRIIVFNRHLHRAEGLVKHFGRSASHMELRAMPWHESIIEAELAKTKILINATSIGLTDGREPDPGRDPQRGPDGPGPHLRPDPAAARRQGGRCDVSDGEAMLLHQGAASFTLWTGQAAPLDVMGAALAAARAGGVRSAEGEPTGEPAPAEAVPDAAGDAG